MPDAGRVPLRYCDRFAVKPGTRPRLAEIDPAYRDPALTKAAARQVIEDNRARMADLQMRLYAERRHAVLICLQGLDAAGKDGVVTHILGAMNPLSCSVSAFHAPTPEEAAHDFLWRYHRVAPAHGHITIFNRTYYESVLVERVHGLVKKRVWEQRYADIVNFERLLCNNNTKVIKIFLYISKSEQLARFKARLTDPMKQWKISESDYAERQYWNAYMEAYEEALENCSTDFAPWYIVPSDRKWFRDLAVSQILVEALENMKIARPVPSVDLDEIRRKYHAAEKE